MALTFSWRPDGPLPGLEEHSKAKLDVLRRYLRAYFDRLAANPARDEFRLDLIDGFAGGGTFQHGDSVESGTPLIMLEEAKSAQDRLNEGRSKPLHFNCKFHFVDVNPDHTNHLRRVLDDHGYRVDNKEIVVHDSPFEDVAEDIIADVLRRQPRAGRAIFLLDQTGFSQVELTLVARIFERLPTAEVILTFAADALINHIADTPEFAQAVARLSVSERQIQDFIQLRGEDGGRAVVQRVMREHFLTHTNAKYDTPFFIRPRRSRRALWFLHLSRHLIARDVMIQCHWNSFNTFEHYGPGDFNMLGWDGLNTGTLRLFNFEDFEAEQMRVQLLNSIPEELHALAAHDSVTVDAMRHALANRTAARFSDLDKVVIQLAQEGEFNILSPSGRIRHRTLTRLDRTDRIAIPEQRLFPGLSRRHESIGDVDTREETLRAMRDAGRP